MAHNQHLTDERAKLARDWLDTFVEEGREIHNINDVGIAYATEQHSKSSTTVGWDRVAYDYYRELR